MAIRPSRLSPTAAQSTLSHSADARAKANMQTWQRIKSAERRLERNLRIARASTASPRPTPPSPLSPPERPAAAAATAGNHASNMNKGMLALLRKRLRAGFTVYACTHVPEMLGEKGRNERNRQTCKAGKWGKENLLAIEWRHIKPPSIIGYSQKDRESERERP
jgi:hypothetical protein